MSTFRALSKNWPMDHKERCKSMFNNEILSDVKFVVQVSRINSGNGESDRKRRKIAIPAHKFLLSICSPVFFAMFCGEMAETKDHIDLPDCEYEGMLEFLRYIYTDEVCLNGNNVMQVLYLAEKYMIPNLTSECTEYLGKNLNLSDVFCVLKQAEQYENKDLLFHCWDLIDKEAEEVLKSNEFLSMERSFLNQLVERDTLNIREVELFKAVDCWAKEKCNRQQLKADGSVKRQVLGQEIVKNIRFPIMQQNEFVNVVLESNILTQWETSNIMKYFNPTVTSPVVFPNVHRVGSLLRCCRFKSFHRVRYLENDQDEGDWFPFKVDKDIILHGISLLGNDGGQFTVTLEMFVFDDDVADDNRIVFVSKTGTFTSGKKRCGSGFYYGFDVIFDEPFDVERDVSYVIEASVDGPGYCLGNDHIDYADSSGVRLNFEHLEFFHDPIHGAFSRSLCAELLFKVKE